MIDNFNIDIHSYDEDYMVKLYPVADGAMLKTSQSRPGSFRNIDIELTDEELEQLRAWIDEYFKDCEERKHTLKLISDRMAAYEVYWENLADPELGNSEIPKNTIEYFNDLKSYLKFSVLAPEMHPSYRHTVIMGFFKASEETTYRLNLEFLLSGNSVSTILYTVESYNARTDQYEFKDEGLKVIPLGTIYNAEDTNLKLCAQGIKDIYDEFMETDYE